MKVRVGVTYAGPAGTATCLLIGGRLPRRDMAATVATWFLDCPGQSPAWRHYLLSAIHLRPIDGARPAIIRLPGATHEVMLTALDPRLRPNQRRPKTWHHLRPINVEEQVTLPDDQAARQLLRQAAKAVVDGVLPAEPPLAGAVEPWRTTLIKSAAHARGEEHAP